MKAPVLNFPFFSATGSHNCRLEFDWLGAERYYVDDTLVHEQWSLLGSSASFLTNGVEIEVRNRVIDLALVTEVRIDGELKSANLMAESTREFNDTLDRMFGPRPTLRNWLLRVALWAVVGFVSYSAYHWLAKHAA